jgi:hypothetical protein
VKAALSLLAAGVAIAAAAEGIPRFSTSPAGGGFPAGWRLVPIGNVKPIEATLVADAGTTVVRIRAEAAAGSLAHRLDADTARAPVLRWRWKVDRVPSRADLRTREGDDYAARVYVAFHVPEAALAFGERVRLAFGRLLYGEDLPAAALCYVWDNRHPPGTSAWNAHSAQVRMIVVEQGEARAGRWVQAERDVEADWRAAFGTRYPGPVPRIAGVAISADTDQTGEAVTAWFGDLVLGARR